MAKAKKADPQRRNLREQCGRRRTDLREGEHHHNLELVNIGQEQSLEQSTAITSGGRASGLSCASSCEESV